MLRRRREKEHIARSWSLANDVRAETDAFNYQWTDRENIQVILSCQLGDLAEPSASNFNDLWNQIQRFWQQNNACLGIVYSDRLFTLAVSEPANTQDDLSACNDTWQIAVGSQ